MIQQIFLMLFMFFLGWAITAPWLIPVGQRKVVPFTALITGCSIYAAILLFMLIIQVFAGWSISITFILSILFALGLMGIVLKKSELSYKELSYYDFSGTIFWITLIVVGGFFFSHFNFAATTNDSHRYIQLGEGLALTGFNMDGRFITEDLLSDRPAFYSIFHALSRSFQVDYLWIFLPAYSAFFLISFSWMIRDMIKSISGNNRQSNFFSLFAVLLVVSSSFMVFNFYYINNHMFTAVHFTLFFLLAWKGLNDKSDRLLILATIILLPSLLMRFENILFVLIFATLLASFIPAGRTVRSIFYLSGLSAAFVSLLYLYTLTGGGSGFISSERMVQTGLLGLAFSFSGLLIGRWDWSANAWNKGRTYIPYIMLISGVLAVSRSFIFDFDTAGISIPIVLYNMLDTNIWNHFWYLIIFLAIFFWIIPVNKNYDYQLFITTGILIFILFTIELSHLRDGVYRIGAGDSANRMIVHIVPTIVVHFTMTLSFYLKQLGQTNHLEVTNRSVHAPCNSQTSKA